MVRSYVGVLAFGIIVACGSEGQVSDGHTGANSTAGSNSSGTSTGGAGGTADGGAGTQGSGASGGMGSGGSGGAGADAGGNGSAGAGGMGNGDLDDPCTWGNPCQPGLYCEALGCGSGTCQTILNIAAQQQDYVPVCGCDGVNYFNPSVAESLGMALAHAGVCLPAEEIACDTVAMACAPGLSCSVEVGTDAMCGPSLTAGTCWGAPIACGTGAPRARGCIPPNTCANKCALIRSENGWYDDASCP